MALPGRLLVGLAAVLAGFAVAPAGALADPGDAGQEDASYAGASAGVPPSGSKPESKLWFADGAWWGILFDTTSGDFHIFRLHAESQAWTDTGTVVDRRNNSVPDALWDADTGKLYVASHVYSESPASGYPSYLYRFSYDASTQRYTLDSGFPAQINPFRTETLVIAKDGTGQLWATWTQGAQAWVAGTVCPGACDDRTWGPPIQLSSLALKADDISSLIAFDGKVGVWWSNQSTKKDYFAVHDDSAQDTAWTTEVAVSGSAMADDHVNLKTDGRRVFAAVKTSKTGATSPLTLLAVRTAAGGWITHVFGTVADSHSRPIVLLDRQNGVVRMFATSAQTGGQIYEKDLALADAENPAVNFPGGTGTLRIGDADQPDMNNATSTKQNVDAASGLVVLATNGLTKRYWHYATSLLGDTSPPALERVEASGSARDTNATVTLTYGEPLRTPGPAAGAFTATGSSTGPHTVTAVSVAGRAVTLGLVGQFAPGEAVTIGYVPPAASPLADLAGNEASGLAGQAVVNATTPPVLASAAADGAALTLAYDEALSTASAPAASRFSVTGSVSGAHAVAGVAVAGPTVTLSLAAPVAAGEAVTVSYAVPAVDPIEDLSGNDASPLAGAPAVNVTASDTTPPVLLTARVDRSTLELRFDETLRAAPAADGADFVVEVGGNPRPVSAVAVAGSSVTLTLASPVLAMDGVTISYAPGADPSPLSDLAGNPAAAFSGLAVENVTQAGGALTLLPNGDGARDAAIRDQSGGTAALWAAVDETVAAADDGTTYVRNDNRSSGAWTVLLTDTPAGFGTMQSVTVTVRARTTGAVDDSTQLFAQVVAADGFTPLTDEVVLATNPGPAGWTTVGAVPLTGAVPGSASLWDGARLRLRWSYQQVGTADTTQLRVTAVELRGTYG